MKKLNCFVGIGREDVLLLEKNEKRKLFGKGLWGVSMQGHQIAIFGKIM